MVRSTYSVSMPRKVFDIIDEYMSDEREHNFSRMICTLIERGERNKKVIAQYRTDAADREKQE